MLKSHQKFLQYQNSLLELTEPGNPSELPDGQFRDFVTSLLNSKKTWEKTLAVVLTSAYHHQKLCFILSRGGLQRLLDKASYISPKIDLTANSAKNWKGFSWMSLTELEVLVEVIAPNPATRKPGVVRLSDEFIQLIGSETQLQAQLDNILNSGKFGENVLSEKSEDRSQNTEYRDQNTDIRYQKEKAQELALVSAPVLAPVVALAKIPEVEKRLDSGRDSGYIAVGVAVNERLDKVTKNTEVEEKALLLRSTPLPIGSTTAPIQEHSGLLVSKETINTPSPALATLAPVSGKSMNNSNLRSSDTKSAKVPATLEGFLKLYGKASIEEFTGYLKHVSGRLKKDAVEKLMNSLEISEEKKQLVRIKFGYGNSRLSA